MFYCSSADCEGIFCCLHCCCSSCTQQACNCNLQMSCTHAEKQLSVRRPVCELYGVDLAFGSDYGAVTQRESTLLVLGCSTALVDFRPGCLNVTHTSAAAGATPALQCPLLSYM